MALFAPMAVPVEVRTEERDNPRRAFRLSASVAESGLVLERPAPFEPGRPVTATFVLPESAGPLSLSLRAVIALGDDDGDGEQGGSHLEFIDPSRESRQALVRYVASRLGLPSADPRG